MVMSVITQTVNVNQYSDNRSVWQRTRLITPPPNTTDKYGHINMYFLTQYLLETIR